MFVYWATLLAFGIFGAITVSARQYNCDPVIAANCTPSILACCDKEFRTSLGLTTVCQGNAVFTDPECLRNNIEYMYNHNGFQGIFTVCSEFYNFQQCLGISYKSCTSARWHILHAKPYNIAELYATIFAQFNFACGAGLDTFISADQCMSKIFASNISQIRNCRQEFYNNIITTPDRKCEWYEQLTSCVEKPFKDTCGLEAGWWGCEYERIGVSLFLPECSPRCQIAQTVPQRSGNFIDLSPIEGI